MVIDVGVEVRCLHVGCAEISNRLMWRVGYLEADRIRARLAQTEICFKRVRLSVAVGERRVRNILEQKLAGGGNDGAVIVLRMVDGPGLNVRRHDDRGNSNASRVKSKGGSR